MAPRIIASDLDGTLLRDDQTVGARTLAAVARIAEEATFVFATGRVVRWLTPVTDAFGHRGLAVCANGALVLDLATGETLYERLLSPTVALDAVGVLAAALPGVGFAVEHATGSFAHDPVYRTRWPIPPGTVVGPVADLFDGPVVKLLVRHEEMTGDDLLSVVLQSCGDLVGATRSSADGLVEVMVAGLSKAAALAWVAERTGTAEADTAAFGDMPNDVEMLRWAGYAVAVANAHPSVKAVADEITASNEDEGVALVLERWLG